MLKLARATTLIGAVTLLFLWLGAPAAYADGNSGGHGLALAIASWPVVLAGLCGAAASQLTAILTHHNAPQWFKSGINLALTTLAGVLITIQVIPGHTWKDYLAEIAVGEIIALGSHYAGLTALASSATYGGGMGATLPPIVAPEPEVRGLIKPRKDRAARRKAAA